MICLNSAGDLARSEVQTGEEGESEDRPLLSLSHSRQRFHPPASAGTRDDRVGRDNRPGEPVRARARARPKLPTGGGCQTFLFKGRPSRDDDLNAAVRGGTRAARKTTERSDGRAPGDAGSAICVQRLDDSLNSAIHTRYRSLLRSSSMHEPRGPPLEVVHFFFSTQRLDARKTGNFSKKISRGGKKRGRDGGARVPSPRPRSRRPDGDPHLLSPCREPEGNEFPSSNSARGSRQNNQRR